MIYNSASIGIEQSLSRSAICSVEGLAIWYTDLLQLEILQPQPAWHLQQLHSKVNKILSALDLALTFIQNLSIKALA